MMPNDKVQLRREFAENVRQTKTRHNLTNIIKTTVPRRQLQRLVRLSTYVAWVKLVR